MWTRSAWAALIALALAPFSANAQRSYAPYDLEQLHPDVRAATVAARTAETSAEEAAMRAREAVTQAEEAAQRARNGEEGYRVNERDGDPQGRRYEGQWALHGGQGWGVLVFGAGEFQGDRYAGGFSCGHKYGLGVYRYAPMPSDRAESRFDGEYRIGGRLGIYYARDAAHYAGDFDAQGSGVGVAYFSNGQRYEGQFADNRADGYGVLWDAAGHVRRAGLFQGGHLVTRPDGPPRNVAGPAPRRDSTPPTCIATLAREQ